MALPTLELPTAPASDVKKRGWRGMMRLARDHGAVVVTNHNEPEAVIVSMAAYTRLLESAQQKAPVDEVLDELRRKFDRKLVVLQQPDVVDGVAHLFHKRVRLNGKVKLW